MARNQRDALAQRHHQAAIVANMVLTIFRLYHRDYSRKHVGAVFEELLVGLAIRAHDDGGGNPMTISAIVKTIGIPRSNVRRALPLLIQRGVVQKEGRGYRSRMDYLAARLDAAYFKGIVRAVIYAADELQK